METKSDQKQGKTPLSRPVLASKAPQTANLTTRKPTSPMAAPKTKSKSNNAPEVKAVAVAKKEIKQAQTQLAKAPASNPAVKAAKTELKQAQKALDNAKPTPQPKAASTTGRRFSVGKSVDKSPKRGSLFSSVRSNKETIEPVNPQATGKSLLQEKDKLAKQIHMASPVVKTKTIEYRKISRSQAEKMAWEKLKKAKEAKVKNVRFKK